VKFRNTLLVGALSALAAVLITPNSGKENRRILKAKAAAKYQVTKDRLAKKKPTA
jgi:gas vesicle protein